jgi:flavorubredoxin
VENIEEKEAYDQPLTETIEEKQIDVTETIGSYEAPPSAIEPEIFKEEDFILSSAALSTEASAKVEPPFAKASEDEEELKFEPYHTIDYFASLGIKFIQEEDPSDKFGKQLKSFTAWLKTMKRSSTSLLETEMNAMTEATIQDIAEHSIEEKEVITEAMAEVLALQGKMDKAIELYHKLSLLNPSKSAYFAGRIEYFKVN